jgi:EAL domain-containing protein (putative c-di-GMP-specific phosphodiesterase class I)
MDGGDVVQGYVGSTTNGFREWEDPRERFAQAFAQNEFLLYSQPVKKLGSGGDTRPRTEIYVRLKEEEQNVVPPGTFLPRLEHYKLGPTLDQHVLRRALAWHRSHQRQVDFILHINLCRGTLIDLEFPSLVVAELETAGLGGDSLCFEIPGIDGPSDPVTHEFAKRLKAAGCSIAVGVDHPGGVTFRPAKDFAADFMKIGAGLTRNLVGNIGSVAKLRSLTRACRTFGIQTVAQHVEDRATLMMLGDLGFDYAQGYEISRPAPMEDSPATFPQGAAPLPPAGRGCYLVLR